MKINKNLVIGAAGIGGVGILIFLLRERSQSTVSASSNTAPDTSQAATTTPISVGGLQTAPFNITGPQTFNFPITRDAGTTAPDSSKDCPCEKSCDSIASGHSAQDFSNAVAQVSRMSFPIKSNLHAQFPPYLYPWLYQDGKN